MKTRKVYWAIAAALLVVSQDDVSAREIRFIVENKYRNPGLYIHQKPDQKLDVYGEVDVGNIDERILQIKTLFPEIYSQLFTPAGRLKAGVEWIDYQKAIQAHYSVLKEDAGKFYGEKSVHYKQIVKEIEDEEFNLGVARYFDNKFGNFTSSRSNFLLNVIPVDVLRKLNQAGIRTASQLKIYDPRIFRQYIASKQLQSDFYLGPLAASVEPRSSCGPEAVMNPVCPLKDRSSVQDAVQSAVACARTKGDAKKAAKIAAETAQQIGAGTKETALILSAIGDSLNLNVAERNRLAHDASRSLCKPSCIVVDAEAPSYLHAIPADMSAFDAARLAAQYAVQDKENAMRIAAETSVQIAASVQDHAMIVAYIMNALELEGTKKSQFIKNIEEFNCTPLAQDLNALMPGAGNENNPTINPGGDGFDNPGTIGPGPLVSPN